jgi:hypothetical protein
MLVSLPASVQRINNLLIPCLAARVLRERECGPVFRTTPMLLLIVPEDFVVAGIRR